jgi:hypothetical protein
VSRGRNQQIIQRPIIERRVSNIQYYSLPEQVLGFEQALTQLKKREALVSCDGWHTPVKIRTLHVDDPYVRAEWLERFRSDAMTQHAFWLTKEEADKCLETSVASAAPLARTLKSYGRRKAQRALKDASREEDS